MTLTITVSFTVPDDEETGPVSVDQFVAVLDAACNEPYMHSNVSFAVTHTEENPT